MLYDYEFYADGVLLESLQGITLDKVRELSEVGEIGELPPEQYQVYVDRGGVFLSQLEAGEEAEMIERADEFASELQLEFAKFLGIPMVIRTVARPVKEN